MQSDQSAYPNAKAGRRKRQCEPTSSPVTKVRSPVAALRHDLMPTGQIAAVTRQHPALPRREAIATARIVFRCEATLYDSIKAVADRNRLSMSEAVRMMIATYLGNDGGRSSDLTRLAKSLRPLSRVGGTTLRPRKAFP